MAFYAAAFNIGISAATSLAASRVADGGLETLPAAGLMAAVLALAASAALALVPAKRMRRPAAAGIRN